MKFILVPLALLVIAGVYLLRRLGAGVKGNFVGSGSVRVVIIVKDQEPWVEGFIRKLFRCMKSVPRGEVLVVDDASRDGTVEVLNRLRRDYSFEVVSPGAGNAAESVIGAAGAPDKSAEVLRFDVRGLRGKDLLRAPLFCHLSHFNAGKSHVLSK